MVVFMPTMYIFAIITGFILGSCSKRNTIRTLQDQNEALENEIRILYSNLEAADIKLARTLTHNMDNIE